MSEQTKEKQVSLKELQRNELICGILGLAVGVIALIFLFVNIISFTGEITGDATITFSTNIRKFLSSDYTLRNDDWGGLSLWSLCNPDLNLKDLQQTVEIIFTVLAWFMLVGAILSVVFYVLFLCKKRLYWLCEVATNFSVSSGVFILLGLILGNIKISGIRMFADGVSYNMVVPIIYAVVMIALDITIRYLLNYSKKRQEILKDLRTKRQMEAAIAGISAVSLDAADSSGKTLADAESGVQPTVPLVTQGVQQGQTHSNAPVTDAAKQSVLARYRGKLSPSGMTELEKHIDGKLTADKYRRLMQAPLKSKTAAILFAIFLGGIGVDRFYVGDTKMGALKLIGTIVAVICNLLIPIFGLILSIANWIWKFVDIFFSYKKIYDVNYENAMTILHGDI